MKQTSCYGLREHLEEYLDGELPPAMAAAVEAHLASCPKCQALVAREQALLRGIRQSLQSTVIPSWLEARVSAAIAFTARIEREQAARR
jgi:anti-sigma factor (TIGR02949 family)